MKKFGFSKKDDAGSDDSNRLGLFGLRSKSKSPGPGANPYAQSNPMSDPYTNAKAHAYAPESNGPSTSQHGEEKSPAATNSRYGPSSGGYGAGGGYGANKYDSAPAAQPSRYGAGGYGGLGGDAFDAHTEEKRDALFGGAKDRHQTSKPTAAAAQAPPPSYEEGVQSGVYGSNAADQAYPPSRSTYGDRQLTAEEEEEEDVAATKQQMRFMKQSDVSSTRNALRIAQQAEETGRDTLARLGQQGENIHATERNLDLAQNQNKMADDKAKELKSLNRSMFAVHVANPFTGASRRAARDEAVINRHLDEREQREATRRAEYQANQRMQQSFKALDVNRRGGGGGAPSGGRGEKNLADRAKYQFEADSDDDEMENEIEGNLDSLGGVAGRLNALARTTGQEVDQQNKVLDRVDTKTNHVDLGIAANSAKLNRFKG